MWCFLLQSDGFGASQPNCSPGNTKPKVLEQDSGADGAAENGTDLVGNVARGWTSGKIAPRSQNEDQSSLRGLQSALLSRLPSYMEQAHRAAVLWEMGKTLPPLPIFTSLQKVSKWKRCEECHALHRFHGESVGI